MYWCSYTYIGSYLSSVRWKYLEGLQDGLPRWYNSVMVHPQLSHNSFQRMAHWWVMGHKILTSFAKLACLDQIINVSSLCDSN